MKKEEDTVKTAALYIRVSTDKQEELSPDSQRRLLLDYAKSHNMIVSNQHIYTENGISGRKADKRPKFQQMIAAAKSDGHPFDVILLWKFPGSPAIRKKASSISPCCGINAMWMWSVSPSH